MNGSETMIAMALLGFSSAPHCAFMCGPLAARACARSQGQSTWRNSLLYTAGRLASYTFLGALAGALGAVAITPSPLLGQLASAALAAVLAWRAWELAFPGRRRFAFHPRLVRLLRPLRNDAGFLGLVTALLPCGAVVAALLLAATSANAAVGALGMTVFTLASAPGTLLVVWGGGSVGRRVEARLSPLQMRNGAIAVLLALSLWTALRPWLGHEHHHHEPMKHVHHMHGHSAQAEPDGAGNLSANCARSKSHKRFLVQVAS